MLEKVVPHRVENAIQLGAKVAGKPRHEKLSAVMATQAAEDVHRHSEDAFIVCSSTFTRRVT